MEELMENELIDEMYLNIKELVNNSKSRVYKTVNVEMINLYWNIGKIIVEKQEGNIRAKYGNYLIERISKKLTDDFGNGFSSRNLKRMRKLYLYYPKRTTLLSQLT